MIGQVRPNIPVCCDLLTDVQITDSISVRQSVRINNLSLPELQEIIHKIQMCICWSCQGDLQCVVSITALPVSNQKGDEAGVGPQMQQQRFDRHRGCWHSFPE